MKNILVTGGAGFVGRHIIRHLLQQNYEVHCVDVIAPLSGAIIPDNWPLFNPLDYKNFNYYQMDCRDWFKQYSNEKFDYTFHLAAMVGGRAMIENNPLAIADDLAIDAAYWQWATEAKPEKSAVFSSSAAYPINLQTEENYKLLKENMISFDDNIGMPDMTYGWAKLTNEYLAQLAYQKHGLKSVCYRPFSGYGEDQDMSYPFPAICKKIIDNTDREQVKVWGTGKQMRDFIHIDDCVTGIMQTIDQIDDASAINLSTGIYTNFIEFVQIATNILGYKPEVTGTSNTPMGVFARGGDITLQNELGFTQKRSLKKGIEQAFKYLSR